MNAIILAGGLGTRLRSVVNEVPKCMAPVAGKPFLYYLLKYVSRKDIDKVILSVGYLREVIFTWIDSVKDQFPFEIEYAIEETPLGTGGGIRLALSKCSSDDVLVLNGDTMFDVPLDSFIEQHKNNPSAAVSLALKPMTNFDRYGTVSTDTNGAITSFNEKQPCAQGNINGGVYIIRRSNLDLSQLPEKFSFEKDVFEPHVSLHDLYGYAFDPFFIDIGIPEDYLRSQYEFLIRYSEYKTLLLDRDGTINKLRPNDYVKSWDEFEFLPLFLSFAKSIGERFERIFIVTNQRGVGKDLMTEEDLKDIHDRMCDELYKGYGLKIDEIFYCAALDKSDLRRKPQTGMWEDIIKKYPSVVASSTIMVGDGDGDQQFAENAGISFARVW